MSAARAKLRVVGYEMIGAGLPEQVTQLCEIKPLVSASASDKSSEGSHFAPHAEERKASGDSVG
jgi:hypothetical protein